MSQASDAGTGTSKGIKSTETAKKVNKIMKDFYARANEHAESGGMVAWCMLGIPPEILENFNIKGVFPENYGTASAATQSAIGFIERAEADGFSVDICSYARNGLGYAARMQELGGEVPPEAARGGMAKPSLLLAPSGCEPRYKWFHALKKYLPDVPLHIYDAQSPPDDVDCRSPEVADQYVNHNLTQLRSLVAFLEGHTGRKLDEDKLAETLSKSQEAELLWWEVNQLRKAVPAPMPSQDFFSSMAVGMYMKGSQEAIDFNRELRDEVKERIEKGIGVIPVEKYRLLWGGIPMWFNMGIFNYFESLAAVFAIETSYGHGNRHEIDINRDDPLEALVRRNYWQMVENRVESEEVECGSSQADKFLEYVRDYSIDGVIMHNTRSCRAVAIGQQHTKNILRNYLKVPSMFVETDMGDARTYSDTQVKMRINAFMETLVAVKEGASLDEL